MRAVPLPEGLTWRASFIAKTRLRANRRKKNEKTGVLSMRRFRPSRVLAIEEAWMRSQSEKGSLGTTRRSRLRGLTLASLLPGGRRPTSVLLGLLAAAGLGACSSQSSPPPEVTAQSEAALTSACSARTVRVGDVHADFRDIWAGRETSDTGKQGEPDEKVVLDFNTTIDPTRVTAQFMPVASDGSCGGSIGATVTGSVILPNVWGTTSSDSSRPGVPSPYNVLARESITGVVSAAGALAAGGDISLTSMSVNGTVRQPVGLIAGGKVTLSNGSVQGNVTYGVASSFPQTVTISGTKSLVAFNVDTAFQNLETVSSLLNEEPATGSVQTSNGTLNLSGTKSGLNVIQISADALQQAGNVVISAPAGAGVLLNVSGANVAIQNKNITLQGPTASGVLWNFPSASFLQISSVGLAGSLLAPAARLTFQSGSINGTVVVRSYASPGSGTLLSAPLNTALLLGSASPTAVALSPAQSLRRGCAYQFVVSAASALTAGGNCLAADLNVPFRVAAHPSDAAARELAGAAPDPALKTLRRFEARPGINTPVADVWTRYESAIGVSHSVLVPVGSARPDTTHAGQLLVSYQQYHLGYPVAGFGYLVATESGMFRSADGKVAKSLPSSLPTPISGATALQNAIQFQQLTNPPWVANPTKYHAPVATLALMPQGASPASATDFRLIWVIGMLGTGVLEPAAVEVDAATGSVLDTYPAGVSQTQPAYLDDRATYIATPPTIPNTVVTPADGTQTINVAQYRSADGTTVATTLSNGAQLAPGTLNTQYQATYGTGIPPTFAVTDPTPLTPWTTTEPTERLMATAQWGLERANAYLSALAFVGPGSPFPWTSIDGTGHRRVLVHWVDLPTTHSNAEYSPQLSDADTVGILFINGSEGPPIERTTLPHEFGHAFLANIRNAGGLTPDFPNRDQSGAIGEALADLYALASVHLQLGESLAWTTINVAGRPSRDVRNPLALNTPDYYLGPNFRTFTPPLTCNDTTDNCGVHANSTVLSHWGYMLAFGSRDVPDTNACGVAFEPLDANPDTAFKRLLTIGYNAAGLQLLTPPASVGDPTFADFRDQALRVSQNLVANLLAPADTTRKLELAFYAVGLGPAFLTAPADPASVTQVSPADEAMSVYPWQSFSWPASADGLSDTTWELQIADDPSFIASSVKLEQPVTGSGSVIARAWALPFEAKTRYYWRVKPFDADWRNCFPVHTFVGTTSPDAIAQLSSDTGNDSGQILAGADRLRWSPVRGAETYQVYVSTTDSNCQAGAGVSQTETSVAGTDIHGLLPGSHYWVEVLPIGPIDFSNKHSVGTCFKKQFDTAALSRPEARLPYDTQIFDYKGTTASTFSWAGFDEATSYRIQFYDVDSAGKCGTTVVNHLDANSTCAWASNGVGFGCSESTALPADFFGSPSLNGYCWDVIAIAANGAQSPPSAQSPPAQPQRRFLYVVPPVNKLSPGKKPATFAFSEPNPLDDQSYGKPVTFAWQSVSGAVDYVLQVGRWPLAEVDGLRYPDNCVSLDGNPPKLVRDTFFWCPFLGSANGGGPCQQIAPTLANLGPMQFCDLAPVAGAFTRQIISGTTTGLSADVAGQGRYCWLATPEILDTTGMGRKPLVTNQIPFCYTTGPAEPEVPVLDNPPDPNKFSSTPITGYVKFPYVPDNQFAVVLEPPEDFSLSYEDCPFDPNAVLYADRYQCTVRFRFTPSAAQKYTVTARVYNSDQHPPVQAAPVAAEKAKTFTTAGCGAKNEACCKDRACDSSDLVCSGDNVCVTCGHDTEPCCGNNACPHPRSTHPSDTLSCENGTCKACGQEGVACCPDDPDVSGDLCHRTTNDCVQGKCKSCGGLGQACCKDNFTPPSCAPATDPMNCLSSSNSCAACGNPGQVCCPSNIAGHNSTCLTTCQGDGKCSVPAAHPYLASFAYASPFQDNVVAQVSVCNNGGASANVRLDGLVSAACAAETVNCTFHGYPPGTSSVYDTGGCLPSPNSGGIFNGPVAPGQCETLNISVPEYCTGAHSLVLQLNGTTVQRTDYYCDGTCVRVD